MLYILSVTIYIDNKLIDSPLYNNTILKRQQLMPELSRWEAYQGDALSSEGARSTKRQRVNVCQKDIDTTKEVPTSYTSTGNKEALCLQYILDFREKFTALHPGRRRLFLTSPNEYGIEKFVCTTLRPTELPYRDLYDLEKCVGFVSNFLHFEPLEDPISPPSVLPSPSQVLKWSVGDSFDFAILLCSLLLGAGYDAFVAYGAAPLWITTKDQTAMLCPLVTSTGWPVEGGAKAQEKNSTTSALSHADAGASNISRGAEAKSESKTEAGFAPSDTVNDQPAAEAKDSSGDNTNKDGGASAEDKPKGEKDGGPEVAVTVTAGADEVSTPYAVRPRGLPESKYQQKYGSGSNSDSKGVAKDERRPGGAWPETGAVDEFNDAGVESHYLQQAAAAAAEEKEMDPHHGRRLHAWVVVRGGKRQLGQILCVEPTTGTRYTVANSPYLSVEGMFNASNFWVCMQNGMPSHSISYNIADTSLWEYVFVDAMAMSAGGGEAKSDGGIGGLGTSSDYLLLGGEGGVGTSKSSVQAPGESILDLSPSWVERLHISRDSFALRYPPHGRRTLFYLKSKLELFAVALHPEGTTLRLTLYQDHDRTIVRETRELFEHRKDHLHHRVRTSLGCVYEAFLPGRPMSLKESMEWPGRRRELAFYSEARLDGLKRRIEVMGAKVTEVFEGRPDNLIYRSMCMVRETEAVARSMPRTYLVPGPDGLHASEEHVVFKMTEKFARNLNLPAHRDPAKRTYYITEGKIRTLYHYAKDRVTCASKMHSKDSRLGAAGQVNTRLAGGQAGDNKGGDITAQPSENGHGTGSGSGDRSLNGDATTIPEETLQDVILAEKDCFSAVRHSHTEMLELVRQRHKDEGQVELCRPIFEVARERNAAQEKASALETKEETANTAQEVNYLTPFLQHVPEGQPIGVEDAARARDACLRALKERLLERANIINTRLNEENASLAKKQAAFQRNQRDNDGVAEEEFEAFCAAAMFRIQILEQRLVQHEDSALKKYADMDAKLSSDPRLSALRSGS